VVTAGGYERMYPETSVGELILWDISKRKGQFFNPGHENIIRACDISPDGKTVISGSDDNTLKLWDTYTQEEIFTFKGFTGEIRSCKFSPDGSQIIIGDNWGQILLLELENFVIHPFIITPFRRHGRIFFRCMNCHSKGKIDKHSLGKEGICNHCQHSLSFNPFIVSDN
jgi:WD40 repeat protein